MGAEERDVRDAKRKRKSHGKSRTGCRNCKLRRVKCDETRPQCKKCMGFGVTCNFDSKIPDLQMRGNGAFTIKPGLDGPQKAQIPTNQLTNLNIEIPPFLHPAIDSALPLDAEHLDRFSRFHSRTILTIGTRTAATLFQNVTAKMCFSHPYLMHVAQSITAIHDRYLSTLPWKLTSKQTTTEIFHVGRAASLFNKKLSGPIKPEDSDPLWAAAAMLGIIAFSIIEASTPEEAWPLKSIGPSDFEWISMSEHKMALWDICQPLRDSSTFSSLRDEYKAMSAMIVEEPTSGIEGIPPKFAQLYNLDEFSTEENNPYYLTLRKLMRALPAKCDRFTIVRYLNIISHMRPEYKRLLMQRDPRALLLMAYWYAKVGQTVWWLERRTLLEGQSTCLYLEKYHPDETLIHELLRFPKLKLGLHDTWRATSWGEKQNFDDIEPIASIHVPGIQALAIL